MTSTFIQTAEADLASIASSASSFILSQLATYLPEELSILKDVIVRAIDDAEDDDSIGEIVADALTILENENAALFAKVESSFLTALVSLGLVETPPA